MRFPWTVRAMAVLVVVGVARSQILTASAVRAPGGDNGIEVIDGRDYVAAELVVGLRNWTDFAELEACARVAGDSVLDTIPRLAAVRLHVGQAADGGTDARLAAYQSLTCVAYAQRHAISRLLESAADDMPDDPYYPIQWHLNNVGQGGGAVDADVDAPEGWTITTGSDQVIAAVVDSGIALDHPEFKGRLVDGWDFFDDDPDPTAIVWHGIKVAGLLGAVANNDVQVSGLDWNCKIMPLKVGDEVLPFFAIAKAIEFATTHGATVISMSLGWTGPPQQIVDDALSLAAAEDVILVASSGNNGALFGFADSTWPGANPLVISVGATDNKDTRAWYSATGTTLDVVAPGADVYTVCKLGDEPGKLFGGTSAATPLVSAIATLLKSLNPYLSRSQVFDLIVQGAEDQVGDPAEDTPGWDPYYGWGRVNLRRSLEALCGCQGGESLIASPQHASTAAGEVVALRVDAGREHAGQVYWILGSASGAGAWPFGPLTLPLTPDDYSHFTLSDANGAVLVNTHGLLDADGQAMGFVVLPKGLPVASPAVLSHVAVVFDGRAVPAHAVLATNVTTTSINP